MTARAFLVRGLLMGLLAGIATFVVGYYVAEPHIETAINLEESAPAADGHSHDEATGGHTHEEGGTVVSRHDQRTWGLLTGTLSMSVVFGGLLALVAAGVVGRIGTLSAGQSTALVTLIGWAAVVLVPFLKYPASPPAVGNADTIGSRTGWYFLLLALSLVAAVACTVLAQRLWERAGAYPAVVAGVAAYVVAMVVVGQVLPTVNELGDFPADTLWYFRRSSLIVTGSMWAVLGVLLTGAVRQLADRATAARARRELAHSL
ncbi:CbtA family protein [Nocardioides anomalus]|uniref:CbtA family protein n=1 Tax=Nocardioides anomalus TaxID=2712223 RepID=A0A6G6WEU5_9ACTN|nr:CbtA family protein [Nocardioides anomalus]QIG43625.1 CbtA family protein [Nocardioides anomalus]